MSGSWIDALDWSEWSHFSEAAALIPKLPGVYMARISTSDVVYVGMAGERSGTGLLGRYRIYSSGRGATTGFGQACLDRALGNRDFVAKRLEELSEGRPKRASEWAREAIEWVGPTIRWVVTSDRLSAKELEDRIVESLRPTGLLWNR